MDCRMGRSALASALAETDIDRTHATNRYWSSLGFINDLRYASMKWGGRRQSPVDVSLAVAKDALKQLCMRGTTPTFEISMVKQTDP